MKVIDEKNKNEKNKQTNKDRKEQRGDPSYSEMVRVKLFCCAFFYLGFLQLICKASLMFKSNLELTLSIIVKERELHESKHVAVMFIMFVDV